MSLSVAELEDLRESADCAHRLLVRAGGELRHHAPGTLAATTAVQAVARTEELRAFIDTLLAAQKPAATAPKIELTGPPVRGRAS